MKVIDAKLMLLSALLTVVALFTAQSYAKIDIKTAVGIWLFDEGKGDAAKDSSENGNDGTLKSDPKWVDGKFGKGLEFDFGAANYVIAPIPHSNSITVVLWAKYKSLPTANSGLFHAQETEDPGGAPATKKVGIWLENSKLLWGRLIQPDGTTMNFPKNESLESDKWYHIALTADENSKKGNLWVDGESVSEVTYNGKLGDFAFAKIGRQGTETWSGVIDEVAVFNQALSKEDIKAIMEGLDRAFAVSPASKLATSWARVKEVIQ